MIQCNYDKDIWYCKSVFEIQEIQIIILEIFLIVLTKIIVGIWIF